MNWNMLYSKEKSPSMEQITDFINNPLWEEFNSRIQSAYQVKPRLEHSCCSMQAGWNIKYKKGGKSLCTLYPMEGYFIALVVVGNHELSEAELLLPLCSEYVQTVFKNTKVGNGQSLSFAAWQLFKVICEVVDNDKNISLFIIKSSLVHFREIQ